METKIVIIDSSASELKMNLRTIEDEYQIFYFASLSEFHEKLQQTVSDRDAQAQGELRDYEAETSFHPIDLMIVEIDALDQNPLQWLTNIQDYFKSVNVAPEEGGTTKFLFTSFEREDLHLATLQHPYLFDVLFKPFDQPLMLQKIEMVAKLPKITSPGHLYSHKTKGKVLITKEVQTSDLTEFGVSIYSPTPVRPGTFGHFRLSFPDQNKTVKFIGRAYQSEPADIPNYFINSFSYFGINATDLRHQRILFQKLEQKKDNYNFENQKPEQMSREARAIQVRQQMMERAKSGPGENQGNISNQNNLEAVFQQEQLAKETKDVVVIDMDRINLEAIESSFGQNFPHATLHSFPTMAFFMKKMKAARKGQRTTTHSKDWVEPAFNFGDTLSLKIEFSSEEAVEITPKLEKGNVICGHDGEDFTSGLTYWRQLIDEEDRDEFEEFLKYASYGEKSELDFLLKHANGHKRWFRLVAKKVDADHILLRIHDESTKNKFPGIVVGESEEQAAPLKKIDLVVVNTAYIPTKFHIWKETFLAVVTDCGLLPRNKQIVFILLNPESSKLKPEDYCQPEILGFFNKPVDRRLFVECLGIGIDYKGKEFVENFLKSVPYARPIEMGRPVDITQISEFGLILNTKNAMHPGTLLNFHSEILTDNKEHGTLGRCFGFEANPNDDNRYLIHFLFYGVRDQSLKRVRRLIREEYVQRKEKDR